MTRLDSGTILACSCRVSGRYPRSIRCRLKKRFEADRQEGEIDTDEARGFGLVPPFLVAANTVQRYVE